MGNENIGQVQQGLVGGDLVDTITQEEFGLVSLGMPTGSCSGSLLRNGWVIAAAHCVEIRYANGSFVPDPARPGQNVTVAPGQVQVTANWPALPGGAAQSTAVRRLEEHWEGPTTIGTGWDAYRTVVALIPDDEGAGPVR